MELVTEQSREKQQSDDDLSYSLSVDFPQKLLQQILLRSFLLNLIHYMYINFQPLEQVPSIFYKFQKIK